MLHTHAGVILLRWGLQHGTSVLVKSVRRLTIATNISHVSQGTWKLEPQDFQALCELEPQVRTFFSAC